VENLQTLQTIKNNFVIIAVQPLIIIFRGLNKIDLARIAENRGDLNVVNSVLENVIKILIINKG